MARKRWTELMRKPGKDELEAENSKQRDSLAWRGIIRELESSSSGIRPEGKMKMTTGGLLIVGDHYGFVVGDRYLRIIEYSPELLGSDAEQFASSAKTVAIIQFSGDTSVTMGNIASYTISTFAASQPEERAVVLDKMREFAVALAEHDSQSPANLSKAVHDRIEGIKAL